MSKNLKPHQYQIGDLVFGKNTPYPVLSVKPQSYNVSDQDFQIPQANEIRMGQDTLKAGPVTFEIVVKDNAPMPYIGGNLPSDLVEKSSKLLTALQREWKADEVRQAWGELKPITYCDGYGSVRRIYGRPRKFEYTRKNATSTAHVVKAEYARIDTLSYTDQEYIATLVNGAPAVNFTRDGGDAQSWFRILLVGPQRNPTVYVGGLHIYLQMDILAGVTVEVNSYPWTRRIIDSNGINRRTTLVGNTKYLDQLRMPPNTPVPMTWSATLTSGDSKCFVLWRDAYHIF